MDHTIITVSVLLVHKLNLIIQIFGDHKKHKPPSFISHMRARKGIIISSTIMGVVAALVIIASVLFVAGDLRARAQQTFDYHIAPYFFGITVEVETKQQLSQVYQCLWYMNYNTKLLKQRSFSALRGTAMEGCTVIGASPKIITVKFKKQMTLEAAQVPDPSGVGTQSRLRTAHHYPADVVKNKNLQNDHASIADKYETGAIFVKNGPNPSASSASSCTECNSYTAIPDSSAQLSVYGSSAGSLHIYRIVFQNDNKQQQTP